VADRYWVGGTNTWNGTAGTKWAATSGAAGGASVPTASDNAIFDGNSGTGTVTISSGRVCLDFNASAFGGTFAGTSNITVSGSFIWGAGLTRTWTGAITMDGSGTHTVTSGGISMSNQITFNGTGSFAFTANWTTS
jgi:fibronectin-binding autotransporter adhesin